MDAGVETLLASGLPGVVALQPVVAKIKVTRSASGEWNIFTNYNSGVVFNLEATVIDAIYSRR